MKLLYFDFNQNCQFGEIMDPKVKKVASPKNYSTLLYNIIFDYLNSGHPDLETHFSQAFIDQIIYSSSF